MEDKKKKNVVVKPTFKQLRDSNRIRLHLLECGDFNGVLIDGDTIENFNFRTRSFRGATFRRAIFKDCNFTGCNWTGSKVEDCVFVDCKMPFGANFESIKDKNEFINCRIN